MYYTDDVVNSTVTPAYIHSQLRANEQDILKRPLYFGGDLTDGNYLDWITSRAKRFFLILVAIGVPDQIFGIVDDSFDDDDLPIAEDAVPDLRLSFEPDKALDKRFYRTQFKFLARILEEDEHIRYADEENVPIITTGLKSVIPINKDGVDHVRLPAGSDKIFARRRINIDAKTTEQLVLSEIAEMKKFSHEHIVSVYASYLQGDVVSVLTYPAPALTLKSFLMDPPKSFENLSKSRRREILMNWPHCLSNALAWLHSNGGHHGAMRPSNIYVDQDHNISLGPLDGEGFLTATIKADDIEAYQYAPPERWKRAVTVKSTGSGMNLPSGGRSARKTNQEAANPGDPSTRRSGSSNGMTSVDGMHAHAFLPVSKSEAYTRFRLSTAVTESAVVLPPRRSRNNTGEANASSSRSTTRASNERGHPARSGSVLSHSSSEGRRKSQKPRGIFLAAPENRSAVVQTWTSIQHDSFAADVFSIGAIILDILTIICKRTYSSFARHRSAKNRNAGRGGGILDASFHANLGQVMLWAEQLSLDAEKKVKAKKDDSQVFHAVGAVIQVIVQCLDRNPDARPKSDLLEVRVSQHIKNFASIDPLHCMSQIPDRSASRTPRQTALEESIALLPPIQIRSDRSASRPRHATIEEEPATRPNTTYSPSTRPTTSRTMILPSPPPSVSAAFLPSLNLDAYSETAVSGSAGYQETSPSCRRHRARNPTTPKDNETQHWTLPEVSTPKQERWDYLQNNDSAVDPSLTLSVNGSEPGGVFTYINYSTSPSDDGREGTTYHYPLPPAPRPPPTRDLPPVPAGRPAHIAKQMQQPSSRHRPVKLPPLEPGQDEIALLRQMSRAAIGGHPPRMSSLQDDEDEDEELYREEVRARRRPNTPSNAKGMSDKRERVYRVRV